MSSPFGPTHGAGEPVADELVTGAPKARRGTTTAIALITGGAVVGGILASTLGASASSGNATTPSAVTAAVSSSAPAPSSTAPGTKKARPNFVAPQTGKVTAVGTDSVTIATTATSGAASTTKTYSVTSTTRISINESGPGALTGVKVGDTVSFNTTTSGGTVLADLRDGAGPLGGGFGGAPRPRAWRSWRSCVRRDRWASRRRPAPSLRSVPTRSASRQAPRRPPTACRVPATS